MGVRIISTFSLIGWFLSPVVDAAGLSERSQAYDRYYQEYSKLTSPGPADSERLSRQILDPAEESYRRAVLVVRDKIVAEERARVDLRTVDALTDQLQQMAPKVVKGVAPTEDQRKKLGEVSQWLMDQALTGRVELATLKQAVERMGAIVGKAPAGTAPPAPALRAGPREPVQSAPAPAKAQQRLDGSNVPKVLEFGAKPSPSPHP